MLFYILIFFFLFSLSSYELINKNRLVIFYAYFLFSVFVILFLGFRQCGFDYENYYYYFRHLNSMFWQRNSDYLGAEKGYAFLNYIIGNYRWLLLLMAAFTIILMFSFIYKYSPAVFFSLFLLFCITFYPLVMGQYRQALAVAMILWAFVLRQRNVMLFIIIVCVASLFHMSAFLALLALFVPRKLLQVNFYVITLLIALVFSEFGKDVFYNTILGGSDFVFRKVLIYSEVEAGERLGLNVAMLLRILFFMIFYRYRKSIVEHSYGSYFLNLYYVGLLIYLGLGFFPQLAGRGSLYFVFFEVILAAMLVRNLSGRRRVFLFLLFVCIDLYRFHTFIYAGYDDYIPYSWGISLF